VSFNPSVIALYSGNAILNTKPIRPAPTAANKREAKDGNEGTNQYETPPASRSLSGNVLRTPAGGIFALWSGLAFPVFLPNLIGPFGQDVPWSRNTVAFPFTWPRLGWPWAQAVVEDMPFSTCSVCDRKPGTCGARNDHCTALALGQGSHKSSPIEDCNGPVFVLFTGALGPLSLFITLTMYVLKGFTMRRKRTRSEILNDEYVSLTDLGVLFGTTSQRIGRALESIGLYEPSEGSPTDLAYEQKLLGHRRYEALYGETKYPSLTLWHRERTVKLLEDAGRQQAA
jgi:hypothetical protein